MSKNSNTTSKIDTLDKAVSLAANAWTGEQSQAIASRIVVGECLSRYIILAIGEGTEADKARADFTEAVQSKAGMSIPSAEVYLTRAIKLYALRTLYVAAMASEKGGKAAAEAMFGTLVMEQAFAAFVAIKEVEEPTPEFGEDVVPFAWKSDEWKATIAQYLPMCVRGAGKLSSSKKQPNYYGLELARLADAHDAKKLTAGNAGKPPKSEAAKMRDKMNGMKPNDKMTQKDRVAAVQTRDGAIRAICGSFDRNDWHTAMEGLRMTDTAMLEFVATLAAEIVAEVTAKANATPTQLVAAA